MTSILSIRDFRNLFIGGTLSQLGDICFMVALPWLVLQMTGSGIALGAVLMAAAIPRAALMLVGGAISDRFPARKVLIAANVTLMICVSAVAMLAARHALSMWMLYPVAVVFGIADAFAIPAIKVLLPSIVGKHDIAKANAVLQSSMQLSLLGGAAAAGMLIAHFGIVPAFAIDACSFAFLIAALSVMNVPDSARIATQTLSRAIGAGVRYVLSVPSLAVLLLVIASVNFCITGATQVGIVALVHARFGSAASFGALVTASAIGSLLGMLIAGAHRTRAGHVFTVACGATILGVCIGALALNVPMPVLFVILVLAGMVSGYLNVSILSALQRSVATEMLGRVMSIVALCSTGAAPLSLAVSGVLAANHVQLLFAVSGAALVIVSTAGLLLANDRQLSAANAS